MWLVGAFNQEKALVGAFSVIVKTDCVKPMEHYTAQHYLSPLDTGDTVAACVGRGDLRRAGVRSGEVCTSNLTRGLNTSRHTTPALTGVLLHYASLCTQFVYIYVGVMGP